MDSLWIPYWPVLCCASSRIDGNEAASASAAAEEGGVGLA